MSAAAADDHDGAAAADPMAHYWPQTLGPINPTQGALWQVVRNSNKLVRDHFEGSFSPVAPIAAT